MCLFASVRCPKALVATANFGDCWLLVDWLTTDYWLTASRQHGCFHLSFSFSFSLWPPFLCTLRLKLLLSEANSKLPPCRSKQMWDKTVAADDCCCSVLFFLFFFFLAMFCAAWKVTVSAAASEAHWLMNGDMHWFNAKVHQHYHQHFCCPVATSHSDSSPSSSTTPKQATHFNTVISLRNNSAVHLQRKCITSCSVFASSSSSPFCSFYLPFWQWKPVLPVAPSPLLLNYESLKRMSKRHYSISAAELQ